VEVADIRAQQVTLELRVARVDARIQASSSPVSRGPALPSSNSGTTSAARRMASAQKR